MSITRETQNVEWKTSWHDEYLKWICGFANAQGGILEIGRNDCGEVIGVSDVHRLLEEIPNKVQSLLGIVVEVNLQLECGLEYLEIVVEPQGKRKVAIRAGRRPGSRGGAQSGRATGQWTHPR